MNTVAVWYRSTILLCIQGQFHICSAGSYILGIGPPIFLSPRRATIPQTCSGFQKIYLGVTEEVCCRLVNRSRSMDSIGPHHGMSP